MIRTSLLLLCSLFTLFTAPGPAAEANTEEEGMDNGLYARIQTNRGDILLKLYADKTPLTVVNFVGLVEGTLNLGGSDKPTGIPFYDGLKFHRVIENFMIQGGCPLGTGTGGPGYTFPDEIVPSLRFDRPGLLAMANAGPDTNGSQFFITRVPTPHLNNKHTIFGEVVHGMDVVHAIRQNDIIKKITIIRKGEQAETFRADQKAFDRALEAINTRRRQERRKRRQETIAKIKAQWPDAEESKSGLFFVKKQPGKGSPPPKGAMIRVHYTGRLLRTGNQFDSSRDRGKPVSFPVGVGRVIRGWDEALLQMRTGEKRTLIIPPDLAYGHRGAGNGLIPPDAWLVFDVELLEIGR